MHPRPSPLNGPQPLPAGPDTDAASPPPAASPAASAYHADSGVHVAAPPSPPLADWPMLQKHFSGLPPLLTVRQLHEALGISDDHARHLLRSGALPVVRLGWSIRVPLDGVMDFLLKGGQGLPGRRRLPDERRQHDTGVGGS
jgi:excisionase family DNA binding protein